MIALTAAARRVSWFSLLASWTDSQHVAVFDVSLVTFTVTAPLLSDCVWGGYDDGRSSAAEASPLPVNATAAPAATPIPASAIRENRICSLSYT